MFKNIKLFKILGVDILLNITWFLLFAIFFTWSGTTLRLFLSELSMVLVLFGTVLLHEFGHVLAARRFGVSTNRIVLNVLGGVAFLNTEEEKKLTPKQHMWVYFSGPLVNIILGLISFILLITYIIMSTSPVETDIPLHLIAISVLVNIIMVVFNLLPIFPMDGGGILRNLLKHFKVKKYLLISTRISQVLCVGLFTLSIFLQAWIMCAISVLFFFYAVVELKKEKSKDGVISILGLVDLDFSDEKDEIL